MAALEPRELRRDLNLSRERMARLIDVSSKTIERLEEQGSFPTGSKARARLARIQEVRDLGLMVYTEEGFRQFLRTPLPMFKSRTPLQMIEHGDIDQVLAALASDYEGLGY
jgi:DNA-binding XRE family transcriptional regulator